jgi:hypothetical protein
LSNILPHTIYGADNLPRFMVSAYEERTQYQLSFIEEMKLQFNGDLLANALDRVEHFGRPTDIDLIAWFDANRANIKISRVLATAIIAFWDHQYDVALMLSIFKIETAMRQLINLLDEPAYIAARKGSPGKYVGIDAMLEILRRHDFDADWQAAIRAFCLGPYGLNTRHDLAHGFEPRLSYRTAAALSLRFLVLLHLMGGSPEITRQGIASWAPVHSLSTTLHSMINAALNDRQVLAPLLRREVHDIVQILRRLLVAIRK